MNERRHIPRCTAFSLVEMVVVVTIIGVIATIAVSRISTSSDSARKNALKTSVTNIRKAIDRYYAEHNRFPGYDPITGLPDGSKFQDQLMKYTDLAGKTSDVKTSVFRYGPYLRAPFPKNPINELDSVHAKATPTAPNPPPGTAGWITILSTGDFGVASDDVEIDVYLGDSGAPDVEARVFVKPGL